MKIDVLPFRELNAPLRQRWSNLCDGSAAPLDSPFYRPEFSEIVDQARGDVQVAVIEDGGAVVALLPFHRLRGNVGRPVGLHLNDFQGVIGNLPSATLVQDVIRGCSLKAWDFDHLPISQTSFAASFALTDASPFIDLAGGYETYERFRNASKPQDLRDSARRRRRLEREHGEVRFEHGICDERVLDQLLVWKRQQFERTSVPDVLAEAWVRSAIDLLARYRSPGFGGVLSALWAGDRLVAAELGPRTGSVYHLQWCAYDVDFHVYSPGRLLGEAIVRWAAASGLRRVEFGKGDQEYKLRAATGQHQVATGSVVASALQRAVRGAWWAMRRWARSSRLRPQLKAAAGYYFRFRKAAPLVAKEET